MTPQDAARRTTAAEPPQDDLSAARAIIRGVIWSTPVWIAVCALAWWLWP